MNTNAKVERERSTRVLVNPVVKKNDTGILIHLITYSKHLFDI